MPIYLYTCTMLIAAVLLLYNATLLLLKGKYNKSRRILAYTNFAWGIMYLTLCILNLNEIDIANYPLLNHNTLILSNFLISIMFFYPLEVVLPGWFSIKRFLLIFSPMTVITLLYLVVQTMLDEDIEELYTFSQIGASLGHFNVWYRFIIILCNLSYCYVLMLFIHRKEIAFQRWKENFYSDEETIDTNWMQSYLKILCIFLLLYLVVAVFGIPWGVFLNTLVNVVCFSFLFYKGLFHESPYPEDFYKYNAQEAQRLRSSEVVTGVSASEASDSDDSTLDSFDAKIPHYIDVLKKWMETEKPYLYKDFKLTDTSRVLPLNRTYLSRIFNVGFHQTFSEVVRYYRIEYAKELLKSRPELPINQVSKASGFSSDSSFIKAFQKLTGTTPKQFKNQSFTQQTTQNSSLT